MKLVIVTTSQRAESQSLRVAQRTVSLAQAQGFDPTLLDLRELKLPFFDTTEWAGWKPISQQLKAADALVLVSPEWMGMASPAAKNFFLFCQDHELDHKPGLIVTVSAGLGGSYPVAELRMSSYKNTFLTWIPEHVILRNIEKEFENLVPRLAESLGILQEYARALKSVRESAAVRQKKFLYGM